MHAAVLGAVFVLVVLVMWIWDLPVVRVIHAVGRFALQLIRQLLFMALRCGHVRDFGVS